MTDPPCDLAALLGALLDRHRRELEERGLSTRLELESGLALDAAVARNTIEPALVRIVALLLASLPDGCELYGSAHRATPPGAAPRACLLLRAQVSGRDPRGSRVVQRLRPIPRTAEQVLGSSVLEEAFAELAAVEGRCQGSSPAEGEVAVRIELPLPSPIRIVPAE